MTAFLKILKSSTFILLWMTIGIIGLFYSRSLLSIFYGGLGAIALLSLTEKEYRDKLLANRTIHAFIGIWLIYLISGLWSENTEMWLKRVNINVPFLAILPGILALELNRGDILKNSIRIFIAIASVSILITLGLYFSDTEYYHRLYKIGQVMPTPVLHVRYAYFLGGPLCALWILCRNGSILSDIVSKRLVWVYSALTIFFLHMLAVRTGIAVLYGSIIFYTLYLAVFHKKYVLLIAAILGLCLSATLAYHFLPTVKEKINYVRWDLKQSKKDGGTSNYSDNLRLASIKNGLRVAQESPILGSGIGDLETAMNAQYRIYNPKFPEDANFPPVNQFIHWLAPFGFLGGLLIVCLFLWPLFIKRKYRVAFTFIYIATLLSCIGEATIELQLGKCFFLMWLGWLMVQDSPQRPEKIT